MRGGLGRSHNVAHVDEREVRTMTTTIHERTVEQVTAFLVPADVLRELATVSVAASTDKALPILNGVRLEWDSTGMTAVATDRWRLAMVHWDGTHRSWATGLMADTPDGHALVGAKDFTAYVKSLPKPGRGMPALVAVRPEGGGVRFTCDTGDGELSRLLPYLDGEFPNYASLFPKEWGAVECISMDPRFVADVAKMPTVRGGGVQVRFTEPTRPMVWTGEGDLVKWQYLLMPRRMGV